MIHQFYKFEPGQCACILANSAEGQQISVRKMSGTEVVLEPSSTLRERQLMSAKVQLSDGSSLTLKGFVVTSAAGGVFLQWSHSSPKEADKVDKWLREYFERKSGKAPALEPSHPAAQDARLPEKAPQQIPAGAMDVGASIRSKAKIVRTSELAIQLETVQVLNMTTIKNLIKEAVDESVTLLGPTLGEAAHKRLLEEAEETFKERFEVYQAEKAGLEETTRRLQEQLERAQVLLEDERNKVVAANQFTVSDAGMVELEQRLGRILDRTIKTGQVTAQVEQEMRAIVSRLLDDERDKIRAQAQQAQNDKIALLEKKVERLAASLGNVEGERDRAQRRAQALEASGGFALRNVITAGLDEGDPDRERKLNLLKEIFKINKEIREELAAKGLLHGLLEEKGPVSPQPAEKMEDPPLPPETPAATVLPEVEIPKSEAEPQSTPSKLEEREEEEEKDTEEVPVLATGGDADPDDLLWEAPQGTPTAKHQGVKIRNLGGSGRLPLGGSPRKRLDKLE